MMREGVIKKIDFPVPFRSSRAVNSLRGLAREIPRAVGKDTFYTNPKRKRGNCFACLGPSPLRRAQGRLARRVSFGDARAV